LGGAILLVARKGLPLFSAIQVKLDRINLLIRETLSGIRVIRAFNRSGHEQRRFGNANNDFAATAIRVNRIMASLMPFLMLVMNLTTVALVWFGAIRIDGGHMQVGDMMAFIQYAMQIMFSLVLFSMMFVMIPRASASAARVNAVLDTAAAIKDPAQPATSAPGRGRVEFRDVTFGYPGAERPALSRISFTAEPGEVIAIIGSTGAGKSTLVHLLLRFYDVQSGSILVDGVDVRRMTQEQLRAKIGYVPQQTVLFSGSVRENIGYGKAGAGQGEIARAAAIAQADQFIAVLKEGYDAAIGQGGGNLSGGQKQRLAIARALVRQPEIYVFDDCFSALDFKTDARLRAALKEATKEATVIMVAQRVSTVMHADRIIVLDEGRIAGSGTHEELLASCAIYREIVGSQLAEAEIA
jgi:ATP-binding cassette subfamily B protein